MTEWKPNYLDNKSFSSTTAKLQLAWDQTCLGTLKECPRKYQYTVLYGFGIDESNPHLIFGAVYHAALERFDHAKTAGASHDDATLAAVSYALEATWNAKLNRPWVSDEPEKTRLTLIRGIIWYLEEFRVDPFRTLQLASGKPAVELSFQFDSGLTTASGEHYTLAGHIDRIAEIDLDRTHSYILDRKTTKHALDDTYFGQFTPDNQFSLYPIAGRIAFGVETSGILVDAVQLGVSFARFERREIGRTTGQLEEWMTDLSFWLRIAEMYALADYWPQNDKACFRCHFRPICARPPGAREQWLQGKYPHRVWDPLTPRGNI